MTHYVRTKMFTQWIRHYDPKVKVQGEAKVKKGQEGKVKKGQEGQLEDKKANGLEVAGQKRVAKQEEEDGDGKEAHLGKDKCIINHLACKNCWAIWGREKERAKQQQGIFISYRRGPTLNHSFRTTC